LGLRVKSNSIGFLWVDSSTAYVIAIALNSYIAILLDKNGGGMYELG
jgi:hypothetical protein